MADASTAEDYRSQAKALSIRRQAFIAGNYVDSADGATFDCISPLDGAVLARVAACDEEDVNRAVAAARKAFDEGVWSGLAPAKRKRTLKKFADLMSANRAELALLETLDMGKPIRYSQAVDIGGAANCIAWYAEAVDKLYDEVAPTDPSSLALLRREPVGVVAAVVPWNFPLLIACWKLGPALAAGNSVVLKPAEQSPLTALRVAELAAEAGIPEGILNVVPGYGETAGQALGRHTDVDCVTFTGSTEVGRLFLKYSAESNMKQVSLECGGKSPNIVMADAPNLDAAAKAAAFGIYFNQGEVCNAGSRLLVEESVKDEFVDKVIDVSQRLQPGDPLDPKTHMGAMVDASHTERVMGYIEAGKKEGAELKMGGNRVLEGTGGWYIEPTLFDRVDNSITIAQEEIFGPVLSTIAFKDAEEALKIGNDTVYGLAAAVWTRDISTAHRMTRGLRAGTVWVNTYDAVDMSTPFGGYKQSGFGRDRSLHALEKYTQLKTIWINGA